MDKRTALIEAITRNDVERIKELKLLRSTCGIVADVDDVHYTADNNGSVIVLTDQENESLGNVIRIMTDYEAMQVIFQL